MAWRTVILVLALAFLTAAVPSVASAGTRLPDDFTFGGVAPLGDCGFDGALLAPGESCQALLGFFPSEFFAGRRQTATVEVTARDPGTGGLLATRVIHVTAIGRLPVH